LVPANGRIGRVVTGGSTPDTAESELDAAELDAPLIDGVRQAAACRQGSGHDVTYEW